MSSVNQPLLSCNTVSLAEHSEHRPTDSALDMPKHAIVSWSGNVSPGRIGDDLRLVPLS